MRITVKTGIISATIWILIKLSFFYLGVFKDTMVPGVLLNILGLLLAIAIGLFFQKLRDTEETNTLLDMKNGMSAGLPYVIIVCIFIYFYYEKINPEFNERKIAQNEIEIEKMVNDPIQLKRMKEVQEEAEVMTKEQIEARLKENSRQGASAKFTAILATLALLILATIYSLLITLIYRKIMFKR